MWSHFRNYFLTGIAVVLPLVLTVLVFHYMWNLADYAIVDPLYRIFPFDVDRRLAVLVIKTLILLLVLVVICLVGFATNLIIIKQAFKLGEGILARVPMVNRVYSVIKDISSTVFAQGKQRELFRSAILIEYPRKGLYSIAFITKASHPVLSEISGKDLVSVFLPTTPNPTSGVLLFLPREELVELPLSIEEAIKLVISAGTLSGKSRTTQTPPRFFKKKDKTS